MYEVLNWSPFSYFLSNITLYLNTLFWRSAFKGTHLGLSVFMIMIQNVSAAQDQTTFVIKCSNKDELGK